MLEIQQRSFKGDSFRPLPRILFDQQLQLFCVMSPWGSSNETEPVFEFLIQNYQSLISDKEKTNFYNPIESLSPAENILRSLVLSCNSWIFKKQNQSSSLKFAYEMFIAVFQDQIISFSQIGQPFVYLDREGFDLQLLGSYLDFSALFAVNKKTLPPLPYQLIGLKSDVLASVFSFPIQKEDRLILLCRDFAPASFLKTDHSLRNLKDMTALLNSYSQNTAFWLGHLFL